MSSLITNFFCCRRSESRDSLSGREGRVTEDDVTERQPLRASDSEETTPREVVTSQPRCNAIDQQQRQQHQPQPALDPNNQKEDRMGLFCPDHWFEICESKQDGRHSCPTACWKLVFLITCLPCCYPCYLTKSLRRRRKVETDIRRPQRERKHIQYHMPHSTVPKDLDDVSSGSMIEANIVFIETPASRKLERIVELSTLAAAGTGGPDETDGPVQQTNVRKLVDLRRKSILLRRPSSLPPVAAQTPHQPRRYTPELSMVNEGDEEVVRVLSDHEQVTSSESETDRRWSRLSAVGNAVTRFSRVLRRTSSSTGSEAGDHFEDDHPPLRRGSKRSSQLSKVRKHPSIYWSIDDEENLDEAAGSGDAQHQNVEMKSSDERIRELSDLGLTLSFSVYDESSVPEWKGRKLRIFDQIPRIDVVVIVVKRGHTEELNDLLSMRTGILDYIANSWRGFYPLLLVEIRSKGVTDEEEEIPKDYITKLDRLTKMFSETHRIRISEDFSPEKMISWIDECLARLVVHARLYKCARTFSSTWHRHDKCPGSCGLSKRPKTKLSKQQRRMNNGSKTSGAGKLKRN